MRLRDDYFFLGAFFLRTEPWRGACSSRTTTWAMAVFSKLSPSGVFAFRPTQSAGKPSNSATLVRIWGAFGPVVWGGQNQAGIDIGDGVTGLAHALQSFTQEDDRIRALPSRIRRRKQRADIRGGDCPEQSVGDGVQQDIPVGVSAQALVMGKRDPANLQRNPGTKFVGVEDVAYPQARTL